MRSDDSQWRIRKASNSNNSASGRLIPPPETILPSDGSRAAASSLLNKPAASIAHINCFGRRSRRGAARAPKLGMRMDCEWSGRQDGGAAAGDAMRRRRRYSFAAGRWHLGGPRVPSAELVMNAPSGRRRAKQNRPPDRGECSLSGGLADHNESSPIAAIGGRRRRLGFARRGFEPAKRLNHALNQSRARPRC